MCADRKPEPAARSHGPLLGRTLETRGFGFRVPDHVGTSGPLYAPAEGHSVVIAPTGAGKLVSVVAPWVLGLPAESSVVVIDPKGEAAAVTARARARRGAAVHVIDPFRLSGLRPAPCNPLRFMDSQGADLVDDARSLAEAMMPQEWDSRDVFWRNRGAWLVAAAITRVVRSFRPKDRTLVAVRDIVHAWTGAARRGDSEGGRGAAEIAALMDTNDPEVLRAAAMLNTGSVETVGGMLHYALEAVGFIGGDVVEGALADGGVDFESFAAGQPTAVYLCLPPHLLRSHSPLLRVWMWAFMSSVQRRVRSPAGRTLFVIDEAAQLGRFTPLATAVTLLRSYGMDTVSLFQDGDQLRASFPREWRTMLNNCRTLMCFGPLSDGAWRDMVETLGMSGCTRAELGDRALVLSNGRESLVERVDYRSDPAFEGDYDPNPFHDCPDDPVVRPREHRRKPRNRARPADGHGVRGGAVSDEILSLWEKDTDGIVS